MFKAAKAFCKGWKEASPKSQIRQEKKMRDNLSEKQLDKSIADSFPASDPASTY